MWSVVVILVGSHRCAESKRQRRCRSGGPDRHGAYEAFHRSLLANAMPDALRMNAQ
jgi:hypothetical protein